MNIALIDVDGHAGKKKWGATIYPNLALAKLAAWHRKQGDHVEWYTPFSHYDRVYMAKVFNFSPDYNYVINNAIHREGVTCRHDCKEYPCFDGIQNFKRNFAMKCKDFIKK